MRRILHCDMDCFYAAVHMRDDPSLQGKPVVIGGKPGGRGVIAAASYEARKFGVRSAMPSTRAHRLCPDAIFITPDFNRYREESQKIFAIYREITPVIQPVSIDEAYLDVSEHLGEHSTAKSLAREIRQRVRDERQLTVSIGVGPNRLVAKIASDFDKPDGLTVVAPQKVRAFLDPLSVRRLHGIGPATEKVLSQMGVSIIADLRALPEELLTRRFGRHGRALHRYARGIDERAVETRRERKSLGSERTYSSDIQGLDRLLPEVDKLASQVAQGLAKRELAGRTVTLKVRYSDFTTITRSQTAARPATSAREIARLARLLLERTDAVRLPVRLLGVTASNLVEGGPIQLSLFDD